MLYNAILCTAFLIIFLHKKRTGNRSFLVLISVQKVSAYFNYGRDFTDDTIKEIIDSLAPDYVTGLTLLGGEPFEHSNQQGLLPLLREVRRIYPDLSIWCFTGYLFDKDIVERMCNEWKETKEMLQYIDVIVDGKYEEDKKDMMLQFKGSSNQRTILVKESLESGNIVLLYD